MSAATTSIIPRSRSAYLLVLVTVISICYCVEAVSATTGDPQFAGFQGQSFQIQDVPDSYLNLLVTPHTFVNSQFSYIDSPRGSDCNEHVTACFTQPGTYMTTIGFVLYGMQIKVLAGSFHKGMRVYVDGQRLFPAREHGQLTATSTNQTTSRPFGRTYIKLSSDATTTTNGTRSGTSDLSNGVCFYEFIESRTFSVACDSWSMRLVNSQYFLNLEASLTNIDMKRIGSMHSQLTTEQAHMPAYVNKHRVSMYRYDKFPMHGLLGQTYAHLEYGPGQWYEGEVSEYAVPDLWASQFTYSTFPSSSTTSSPSPPSSS